MTNTPDRQKRNWLTLEEVASEVGMSYSAIYFDVRTGELKAYRVPGTGGWRVKKTEAVRYIKERRG